MNRLPLGLLASAVVGGLVVAGCGATKVEPSPYGTTLFITTRWASAEHTLNQLRYTGFTATGTDAFAPATRPEAAGDVLTSGQTVRVLLADDLVGNTLDVVVHGLNDRGQTIVFGQARSASIEANREQAMVVELGVEDGGVVEPGPVDSGVADAGSVDGGRPGFTCACNSTCCLSMTECAPPAQAPRMVAFLPNDAGMAAVADCGPTGRSCNPVCDPLRATNCAANTCSCGLLGPCPFGTRCNLRNGTTFECVCDVYSNCPGCCSGNDCRATTNNFCGNAGTQCTACPSVSSCNAGFCAGTSLCTGNRSCRSGRACLTTDFPVCRNTGTLEACVSCDALRSSACGALNIGCVCGTSAPCSLDQFCDRTNPNVTPTCKPLRP